MLIQTEELEKILNERNLLVIDTRSFKEYVEGHIPTSVNLDLFAFHWIDTTKEGIESFNQQARNLLSFSGVSDEKKVVFYDDVSGMLAARGAWMLLYFSHPNVFMLDGGIKKWKNEARPIEKTPNAFKPTNYTGIINENLITGFEYLRDNLQRLTIIDVRSKEEFNGAVVRAARRGHIPNSVNIDWNKNLKNDGTLKSNDELEKIYKFPKDSEVITYCQGAYRAANSFLTLKKLGFKNVRVYLGSWEEWGNKLDLPVE